MTKYTTKTGRPKCDTGFACGNTCIAKSKSCLDLLSPAAAALAKRFIDSIKISAKGYQSVGQSIESLSAELFKPENIDFLKTATTAQIVDRATSWRSDLTDFELRSITDAVFMSLTGKERLTISTRGGVTPGYMWNPEAPNEMGGSNHDRTRLILQRYIQQNGRDAYTGLPMSFDKMDLEHIVSISNGGSDTPSNIVLASSETNSSKGNIPVNEWAVYAKDNGLVSSQGQSIRRRQAAKGSSPDALSDLVAKTDDSAWTSEKIDKFGIKFYYVSASFGLRRTLLLPSKTGKRKSYTTPGPSWAKPLTKAMAAAKRDSNDDLKAKVRVDWDTMVRAVGVGNRAETAALTKQIQSKYKSYA